MEISHKHFDESCELKLIEELKIKYKTVMSVGTRQREKMFFCNIYFVWEIFFICVFSQYIAY